MYLYLYLLTNQLIDQRGFTGVWRPQDDCLQQSFLSDLGNVCDLIVMDVSRDPFRAYNQCEQQRRVYLMSPEDPVT